MKRCLCLLVLVLVSVQALAQDTFVVSDIRVEGLQRISAGSLFASLPINAGDSIGQIEIRSAIRTL